MLFPVNSEFLASMIETQNPNRQAGPQGPLFARSRGFALVITLTLLILLTVVAVGLLSLSSVTLRSGSQVLAQAEARANARLALMLAIGDLQKQLGPDQRISAAAAITDPADEPTIKHPHWTGVWDSWIAGDLTKAPVNERYPDPPSAHQTIDSPAPPRMHPTYDQKSRYFRGWLLSLNSADDPSNILTPMGSALQGKIMPLTSDDAVQLVGKGSIGTAAADSDIVSARLLDIKAGSNSGGSRGRYAWWVGDESQKATIMEDSYDSSMKPPVSKADRLFRQQAPASMGNTSITGLDQMTDNTQLAKLASQGTLKLVTGVAIKDAQARYHDVTISSVGVLADVREGGLKRDLSTLLERPIDPAEVYNLDWFPLGAGEPQIHRALSYKTGGQSFMLYEFDSMHPSTYGSTGQAAVPIQDLAAYYQLYDGYRKEWNIDHPTQGKGGIQYSSADSTAPNNLLANGIMTSNVDYGIGTNDFDYYQRGYQAQYRNPIPVKFEMILSYVTEVTDDADKNAQILAAAAENPARTLTLAECDPYKLKLGLSPAITFWNPNNVPVVMNFDSSKVENYTIMMRESPIPVEITFIKSASSGKTASPTPNETEGKKSVKMNYVTGSNRAELYTFFLSGKSSVTFEPGQSKIFSLKFTSGASSGDTVDFLNAGGNLNEDFDPNLELVSGWNPKSFVRAGRTILAGQRHNNGVFLTFKPGDYIRAEITAAGGPGFGISFAQKSRHGDKESGDPATQWHFRSYSMNDRFSGTDAHKNEMIYLGFPRGARGAFADRTKRDFIIDPRSGSQLITSMGDPSDPTNFTDDQTEAFFYYGIKAATETSESRNNTPRGAVSEGCRFPSRPFLHSSPIQMPFLDSLDGRSLYNYGWSWFFTGLDNIDSAMIPIATDNSGYYGGGYSKTNGTTHVVQQQLPLTPPISIAALSSARLGGYSLATEPPIQGYNGTQNLTTTEGLRRVTAVGHAGLAPANMQAIGNSYAHPLIPADKAYTTWDRTFVEGPTSRMPFVDHSYLANKALWDDFFFSSITPQPNEVKMFDKTRTAEQVATDFFFPATDAVSTPLPNRRIQAYSQGLDQAKLTALFGQKDVFGGGFDSANPVYGLADKIAAHLMVKGAFNVNSTSVEAWKALFSSLKGKPVAYLDKSLTAGVTLQEDTPAGVPVAAGDVPNAASYQGSSSSPSDPEQWLGWRSLTKDEIEELAKAMVKQVKKRGPFLSLSEFVNRRLEGDDTLEHAENSVKGALQAAIDDPTIAKDKAINGGFRDAKRLFKGEEKTFVQDAPQDAFLKVFPKAMDGAVAYGSSAYVDQADILRNLAEQLTPRGDTFVIRTYGDSIDASGKIVARAWCEAVIQRVPDYVDSKDEPHLKQAALTSDQNKKFGRKFNIVQFRWLNASEI